MLQAPRVESPIVLLNVAGVVASALSAWVGLRVATPDVERSGDDTSEPTTKVTTSSPTTTPPRRATAVKIPAGKLTMAPNDWESVDKIRPLESQIASFWLDRHEVTYDDWTKCPTCASLNTTALDLATPVVKVSPDAAQVFCSHNYGRLPTRSEWVFAASSTKNNRYPWGQTGLVCRTVVFGMVNGPCEFAHAAQRVGSRPRGATESGIFDLAGNVAEWAIDGNRFVALGGSFRSTLASQLKVWAAEETSEPRDDIGFRCAYDGD